jgi:hypothetical protein
MKWLTALLLGAVLATVLPTAFDGGSGQWTDSWAGWGTIRPKDDSYGLLFSVPLFMGAALAFRAFFNWHRG